MKTAFLRLLLAASLSLVALAPAAAFAQDHGDDGAATEEQGSGSDFIGGPDWDDAKDVTIWSMVGIGVFGAVLGVLYLFKRKIGAFPEHPSWVAPISIMPASELPGDDADAHGHAAGHDSHHAPAH